MKKIIPSLLLTISLVLVFCSENNNRGSQKIVYRTKGHYSKDKLEVGQWQIFDVSGNHLIEEGSFSNGIREGEWHYYIPRLDTITWLSFDDSISGLKTNIPDFLKLVEHEDNLLKFENTDSTSLFNLVFGKGYIADTTDLDVYRKLIFEDLSSRSVVIIDTTFDYIETTEGNKYLFTYIAGESKEPKQNFILLNIVGRIDKRLIEITLRCDQLFENRAWKIFFSIIPNLFIDSHRFISPEETIKNLRGNLM